MRARMLHGTTTQRDRRGQPPAARERGARLSTLVALAAMLVAAFDLSTAGIAEAQETAPAAAQTNNTPARPPAADIRGTNTAGGEAVDTPAEPPAETEGASGSPVAPPATAAARALDAATRELNRITAELERLEKAVERSREREAELSRLRGVIEDLQIDTVSVGEGLAPTEGDIAGQIRRLGPPPAEGAPPENAVLSEERTRLAETQREIAGKLAAARVADERARQLLDLIQSYRRGAFRGFLFEQAQSPLSFNLWRSVLSEGAAIPRQATRMLTNWWSSLRTDHVFLLTMLGFLVGVFILRRVRRAFMTRYRDDARRIGLSASARATVAVSVIIVRAAGPVLLAGAALLIIGSMSQVPQSLAQITGTAFWAFCLFTVVRAVAWTVLAVRHPTWRLVALGNEAARQVRRLLVAIAGVYALGLIARDLVDVSFAPATIITLVVGLASLAIGALMVTLGWSRVAWGRMADDGAARLGVWWLRLPILIAGLAIVGSALAGYVNLAAFIADQAIVTGSIVALALLAHATLGEVARYVTAAPPDTSGYAMATGDTTTGTFRAQERGFPSFLGDGFQRRVTNAVRGILGVAVFVFAALLILLQWGFDFGDILLRLRQAFFGFDIGAFRISIAAILVGAALFLAGIFATRLMQRSLARTVLSAERMDAGLAHSINVSIGYIGLAVSALIAISYAGFSFANLAIVAGALSVGIGFGLQSIVNNFVSGLILLAERPIQVGDWIVVGDQQGYVRQISVRATVIETFDRASLIIPNSDLMTGVVTNWTYGSRLGRVVVKVGTSYDANPREVHDTLVEIGRRNPLALKTPAPSVIFEDFADSTMLFQLRIFIADINNVLRAQSELRMAIWEGFRERGISIDYPQLDVHITRKEPAAAINGKNGTGSLGNASEEPRPQMPPAPGQQFPGAGQPQYAGGPHGATQGGTTPRPYAVTGQALQGQAVPGQAGQGHPAQPLQPRTVQAPPDYVARGEENPQAQAAPRTFEPRPGPAGDRRDPTAERAPISSSFRREP